MALSRIRTSLVTNAVIPFTKFDGTAVLTLVTISGQFPFYEFDGTYDAIPIT
jgi:hypothetical protein